MDCFNSISTCVFTQVNLRDTVPVNKENEKEAKERDCSDIPESSQRAKRNGNAQRVRTCIRAMICQKHTGQVL